MIIAGTQWAWGSGSGGWNGHILCHFTALTGDSHVTLYLICWLLRNRFWNKSFVLLLFGIQSIPNPLHYGSQVHKNKRITQINRQTDLTQKEKEHHQDHRQYHLCSVSFWLSLAFFSFFNCLIIHLQALIYPPSSALYVRPLCETFSWISNELVAYKVFLPGRAPIYGHVCLFFININPLGDERPYAIFSRAVPGRSLGRKSHCFS